MILTETKDTTQLHPPSIRAFQNSPKVKAIVIGSGLGGLATAIRLRMQSYEVAIFEANDYIGGKMDEYKQEGFRFDLGPSVFTMPQYIEELFALAGKKMEDYLVIERPELPFNYFFEDGTVLHCWRDLKKLVTEFALKTTDDEATIWAYLEDVKHKFELTEEVFLKSSLHIFSNYLRKEALWGALNIRKVEVFKSLDKANRSSLKDPKSIRLFNTFASYLGSNPYRAPGVLKVVSHFQLNLGVYLPKNGIYGIANALKKLAQDIGIKVFTNSRVEEILVQNQVANGIRIGQNRIYSDLVVSNLDITQSYKSLLPNQVRPTHYTDNQKGHSALVFLWGMDKTFPELTLHNMFPSKDMDEEYQAIFKAGKFGKDATVYLYISKKVCGDDAPSGKENWYILVNAPHNQGQDWEALAAEVKELVLKKLEQSLGQNIRDHILFEHIQDPRTFSDKTGTTLGAIYGNSFNGTFSVFRRHPNFSSKIGNLYFCGGTVHPGAGVPLTLLSGKIVSKLVAKRQAKKQQKSI